jgi:DNA-binding transcriptional LysR family regulator
MLGISMAEVAAFAILVDCESFQDTARRMNLTQPAVSKRILRLERALGARLVDRSVRRFTLTPAGRRFLPRARAMLEALAEHRQPRESGLTPLGATAGRQDWAL